jgi:hypothetical protein
LDGSLTDTVVADLAVQERIDARFFWLADAPRDLGIRRDRAAAQAEKRADAGGSVAAEGAQLAEDARSAALTPRHGSSHPVRVGSRAMRM